MTFSKEKCKFSMESIRILGYEIRNNEIKPDPSRLSALTEMTIPSTGKGLKRLIGLFAYYSRWIRNFSDKISVLVKAELPLGKEAIDCINFLKNEIRNAVKMMIDEKLPFTIETNESDMAIAATLNQDRRPVAFFSRTLINLH